MKKIENTEIAPFAPLIYKLFKSTKNTDDLSIGCHRVIQTLEQAIANFERTKGNYHV